MIAGASGMELVLLVVAADEGVMPQTREHVAACELLGLRRAVVAMTKLDKAGEELATLAGEEARELLLAAGLESEVVLCSGRTGEGMETVREAVRRAARAPAAAQGDARQADGRPSVLREGSGDGGDGHPRRRAHRGRGAALRRRASGDPGDLGARAPRPRSRRHRSRGACRLAVNLAGLWLEEVDRGDVVSGRCQEIAATRSLDVALPRRRRRARRGERLVHVGTARTARIDPTGAAEADAEPGAPTLARLRLGKAIVVVGGDRFVLRGSDVEGPAGAVLGGGEVLDAKPPRGARARSGARWSRRCATGTPSARSGR